MFSLFQALTLSLLFAFFSFRCIHHLEFLLSELQVVFDHAHLLTLSNDFLGPYFYFLVHVILVQLCLGERLQFEAHNVSNLLKSCLVEIRFELCALGALQQASHRLGSGSFLRSGERTHSTSDQNELLLKIVEANNSIDLVPVVAARIKSSVS